MIVSVPLLSFTLGFDHGKENFHGKRSRSSTTRSGSSWSITIGRMELHIRKLALFVFMHRKENGSIRSAKSMTCSKEIPHLMLRFCLLAE